jgi:hypothetical protein
MTLSPVMQWRKKSRRSVNSLSYLNSRLILSGCVHIYDIVRILDVHVLLLTRCSKPNQFKTLVEK